MKNLVEQKNVEQQLKDGIQFCAGQFRVGLESRISDPEERALWLDWIDIFENTAIGSHDYCVEVLERECEVETVFEEQLLHWLNLYLNRDLEFDEAWILAQKALVATAGDNRIARYGLEEGDRYEIQLWMERLTDFGVSQENVESMAREIVQLLRRLYLSNPGSWFSEEDELKSRELLGDLWNAKDEQALKEEFV